MPDYRLGDDVDDYCIKCKRLTNHAIVSLMGTDPAKVRCRTCYNDHDFRRCEIPPSKKDLKKMQLFNEVLAAGGPQPPAEGAEPTDADVATESVLEAATDATTEATTEAVTEVASEAAPEVAQPAKKGSKKK
jgi:hypothetical protein